MLMSEDNGENGEIVHEGHRSEVYLAKRRLDLASGMTIEENVVSVKSADLDTETVLKMADAQFEKQKTKKVGGKKRDGKEKWRE